MEKKVDAKVYSAGEVLQMFREAMSDKKDKKLAKDYPYDDAVSPQTHGNEGSKMAYLLEKYGKYMK